jgi:hypothetical protein
MRSQSAISLGCIVCSPFRPIPRPQTGGRRPPHNTNAPRRALFLPRALRPRRPHRHGDWLRSPSMALFIATVATLLLQPAAFAAQSGTSLPNLAGTYRCDGNDAVCAMTGRSFAITQSGADLEIKNEKGEIGSAKLTSNISLSAGPLWNMFGVLSPDNRAIQWSNGTNWRKQ